MEQTKKTRKLKHQRKSNAEQTIAKERIQHLFEQAAERYKENKDLANRYVELARKIAMKCKVKFTSLQKRQFCKKCKSFLVPGNNCRVRLTRKTITYSCKVCKRKSRIGYKQRRKDKKINEIKRW